MLADYGLRAADILLPRKSVDLYRWAVVACDQYTSQPEYWREVESIAGDAPSTLRLIYPEAYLSQGDARIAPINQAMADYVSRGIVERALRGFVYVERATRATPCRRGLVVSVDLEAYDYSPGSTSPIRATEGTILDRLPPRMRIREHASLELPHILLLVDDPARTLIEPLSARRDSLRLLYDTPLMMGGGSVRGYAVEGEAELARFEAALAALFAADGDAPLRFAVGDGNHSLATARACWLKMREGLSAAERENHPARFALCELMNLHDEGLAFHPIHRVLFNVDGGDVLGALNAYARKMGAAPGEGGVFLRAVARGGERDLLMRSPLALPVQLLQPFLDEYLAAHKEASIDYIHGDEATRALAARPGALGLLLPSMDKHALFPAVRQGGVLPRKTFSMGGADEKRYYLEARAIR